MLTLCDTRAADVDGHLTAIGGMHQLGKGTTVVHVHFQGILKFVGRQIGQIQGVELLGKGAVWHFRHHECSRLCLELLQQIYDLAQRYLVGHGNTAVTTISFQNSLHTVKFTVLLLAFQQVKHSLYQIVNVQQLQLSAAVVDGEGLVVGDCPAEGADGTIVLGAAVAHQVDKSINSNLCPSLLSILEEKLFTRLLAATVLAVAETACQGGLNG